MRLKILQESDVMVKFGIVVWKTFDLQPYSYDAIRNLAIEAERLGFESFWLADHLQATNPADPCFECYMTLSALAADTERIRLGPLVTCVSYRHPSLLAKAATTLDVISKGRLEFALGAGWDSAEYSAYGIPFPPASVRLEQLEETILIIRKMWTESEPSFDGKQFSIKRAANEPKPIQKPHPPIWIGARGKKMLKLTAIYADGWNIDTAFTPETYKEKLQILTEHCRTIGRNVGEIRKSVATEIVIGKSDEEVHEYIRRYSTRFNVKPEDYRHERIVGTPDQITGRIREFVELGAELMIVHFPSGLNPNSVELFADRVMSGF